MADASAKTSNWNERSAHQRALSLWMPRLTSAELEYTPQRDLASARSREMAISSAYGANALRIHRDNVVGPRFTLALRPMWKLLEGIDPAAGREWAREVELKWEAYANSPTFDCDAQRVLTFPWLLHMAYFTFLTSGESLGVLKWKESPSGVNTCVQMIEPERLQNPPDRLVTLVNIRNGVEVDDDGAPVAYHIRKVHPTDIFYPFTAPDAYKWIRVERATPWGRPIVLHMVDRTRPDMRRGISQFASALRGLKMTEEYDAAELEANVMRASFAAVVKTELDRSEALGVMGAKGSMENSVLPGADVAQESLAYMQQLAPWQSEMDITVNGARAVHLLPGESLELLTPDNGGISYEAFQSATVRKLAAGLGVTAEALSRDFGQMTFASAQMSLRDIYRHYMVRREMIIRQHGLPHVAAWLEEQIDKREIPLPSGKFAGIDQYWPMMGALFARSTFLSWGPPIVDPTRERDGQVKAMAAGLSTLQIEANEAGYDWEEMLEQQALERDKRTELDIPQLEEIDAKPPPPGMPGEDTPPSKGTPAEPKQQPGKATAQAMARMDARIAKLERIV